MEKHPLKGKKGKRWLRKVKNLPATDGKKKNDEEDQSQLVIGGCYYSSDDDDVHRCCVVRDFCKTRQSYLLVFEGTLGKESEWIKQDRIALAAAGGVTEKSFESKEEEEDDEDEDEDEDVLVLTPLPVGVFEANQGSSESSVAATHVTFEECLGRKLKVWWEEDACFYKGVVASTLVSPDPQDPQGQVLEMKITYEDHFEETLPFYSSSVQWINQCIQVSAPVKETAAAAAGAESNVEQVLSRPSPCLDETVEPTRKSEGESKTDYSSCAMGWRVGVEDQNMSSALKNGTLKYQYGFVESARTQSDDSSGSSSCASGDVLELLIRLDSGSHCIYKGPDHVLPGRPKGEGERKQKVVAWVYPPQMNFDFFGNSTGKIFQVVYWNPAASFTPTIIELTLKESDLEDSYSSCEMRYRTSANEDFSKKMDLREAMIQWPSHGIVCKETELYSRYKYSIQQKDMLKKCQYYLFGLTFALVPFVGHSIAYPKGSEFHGLDMERLKGTRILSTTLYQLQDGSIAFEIKCGILLDFSKDDYDLLYDFSEEAEKVPLSRYVHNNCPEGDKSLPSYPYLDVLGKAGDLESTSTCLPMMLPVMCGKEEGVFVASRGLIIYKGFGMSPSSFADMCSLGAKDYWRQAITVVGKPPSTTTTTTSTLTLGQWLQDYKIDLSKTVYFALCHNNKGVVNVGVKKMKTFLRSKKDEEEPYCGHTKELWDVFEEVLGEDKVRRSLFGEWINASGLQAKGRPSSGKITLDDALVQMFVKLHSKINSVPLCRGKEPCWVNRLLQQEYKALCLIREYLDEKAIEFKWIDPVGLLIELLKFAKVTKIHFSFFLIFPHKLLNMHCFETGKASGRGNNVRI